MANTEHISTKMVLERKDAGTGKKTRYTFPYLKEGLSDASFVGIAAAIDALRAASYTNLFKIVEEQLA